MRRAALDTNVLFASANARDSYHGSAREIVAGVDHGDLPNVVVTNYVVAETLNLVREKLGPEPANGMLERFVSGKHFSIEHATQADFTTARALFRQYDELSFVDATIVAYMHRAEIDYLYSFDDDFDAVEGITRLDSATNPFA